MKLEPRERESTLWLWLSPLLAIVMTALVSTLVFFALDQPPLTAMRLLFIDPIRDGYGLSELFLKMTPILLCAIGLSLCFRARVWNIGAEGQYLAGCITGGAVALWLNSDSGNTGLYLSAALGAGVLGGIVWAGIVALLRNQFRCNEVLTSIMLNYIALHILLWAVAGPLKDPAGFSFPESALLEENMLLPLLTESYRVHIGFPFAVLMVAVLWVVVSRSLLGFQLAVLGSGQQATQFAGFSHSNIVWVVMIICGSLAGLAGVMTVTGPVGQVTPHLSSGYGFTAIIAVFLGRSHPLGILLATALLSLSYIGGENLQIEMGLPKSIALMFQGLLLFFLLATDLLTRYRVVWEKVILDKPDAGNTYAG